MDDFYTTAQEQAYNALKIAAEKMGKIAYAKDKAAGKTKKRNYRFTPTQEHQDIISAMPKVLSGEITPEEAMAMLHQYDVFNQRFDK